MIALPLLLSLHARAQDGGVDAHGPVLPPTTGDPVDPMVSWHPMRQVKGAWSVAGVAEYVDDPLVRIELRGPGEQVPVELLDNVLGLNLGGTYALHERFALGLSVPFFLTSGGEVGEGGPTLGDLYLWAPVGLVLPGDDGKGFGLSGVGFLSLPTGNSSRFLGDSAPALGALGAIGFGAGPVVLGGNLGVEVRGTEEFANQSIGGAGLRAAFDVGVVPTKQWGVHLEGRVFAAFDPETIVQTGATPDTGDSRAAGTPAEILLTFRGHLGKGNARTGAFYYAGAGRGVSSGVGAPNFRVLAGAGYRSVPETAITPTGGKLEPLTLKVVDPAGLPVVGAKVVYDAKDFGVTDADGKLELGKIKWAKGVSIAADGFQGSDVADPEDAAVREVLVTLQHVPSTFTAEVKNQEGQVVPATITAIDLNSGARLSAASTDGLDLPPGRWRIEVAADGFGTQARELVVAPAAALGATEVIMLPDAGGDGILALSVGDPEGEGVPGARVLLDGQPVGTTGDFGYLELSGLSLGEHTIEVAAERFTQISEDVELKSGKNERDITLRRLPGTVKVVVKGPDGIVADATARFDGPSRLPPAPLGDNGVRYFGPLRPGSWELSVISPSLGIQQREVVVPPDEFELIVVEVVLQPSEQGTAELELRLVDVDGNPVEGASLVLDDKELGTTSTGGTMRLNDLRPGPRTLVVAKEHMRKTEPVDLLLVDGFQEQVLTLEWDPGSVQVTTRQPKGPVDDAVVRFVGGQGRPSAPLGPGGQGFFNLGDGDWIVLVTSEEYGLAQRDLSIAEDSGSLHEVDIIMSQGEGGLANLDLEVTDPDGNPVSGAEVTLDGTPLGSTANGGGLQLKEMSAGSRELAITADLYEPVTRQLKLTDGDQDLKVQLQWAAGATRVKTRSKDGPVTDAVVRLIGPTPMPPMKVDAKGLRTVKLSPGTWQAVVVSEAFGIDQRTVEVTDKPGLTTLDIELAPVAAGASELLVRVLNEDGAPVPGAKVKVGDTAVSAPEGVALIGSLVPGATSVSVSADHYEAATLSADLQEGSQERIVRLAYRSGSVKVVVKDTEGNPVDALVHFEGPAELEDEQVGQTGERVFALRPGTWKVVAQTKELGPKSDSVTIESDGELQTLSLVLEATRVAFTATAVEIKDRVQFEFDSARLTGTSTPVLDEVANTLIAHPEIIRVEVQGHADNKGGVVHNQELSERRANSVRKALIDRGVAPEILVSRGYGLTRPIASNDSEEGRAQNRRVQFEILERAKSR